MNCGDQQRAGLTKRLRKQDYTFVICVDLLTFDPRTPSTSWRSTRSPSPRSGRTSRCSTRSGGTSGRTTTITACCSAGRTASPRTPTRSPAGSSGSQRRAARDRPARRTTQLRHGWPGREDRLESAQPAHRPCGRSLHHEAVRTDRPGSRPPGGEHAGQVDHRRIAGLRLTLRLGPRCPLGLRGRERLCHIALSAMSLPRRSAHRSLIRRVSRRRQILYPFGWPEWGGHHSPLNSQIPSCAVIEPIARHLGIPYGWLPLIRRSQPTGREPLQAPHGLVPSARSGDCLGVSEQQDRLPRPCPFASRIAQRLYGLGVWSKRLVGVWEPAPGCDTACEVRDLFDGVAVLGVGAHSGFIPSSGPLSSPTGPLP